MLMTLLEKILLICAFQGRLNQSTPFYLAILYRFKMPEFPIKKLNITHSNLPVSLVFLIILIL